MKKDRVCAVVVTYNRKELLGECLTALLNQTVVPDKIILINNASTDGTLEYLDEKGFSARPELEIITEEENLGGAGGFYEGLRHIRARRAEFDWAWVMDDDTIPQPDALEGLVRTWHRLRRKVSFLASCVYGPEGESMNVPEIDMKPSPNGYRDWYTSLDNSCVRISNATFVSLLIRVNAIARCGLPCKDYFIWGDDTEYTSRLIKYYGPAYLTGSSKVIHKRVNASALSLRRENDTGRIRMFHYFYRNNLINRELYQGPRSLLHFLLGAVRESVRCLPTKNGIEKFKVVYRGIGEYAQERKKFRHYINGQLHRSR